MSKRDRDRQDRYFQLHHYMLKTDAWRALGAPGRAVYVAIGSRYNGANNGRLSCSVRDAASECRLNKATAAKAFGEPVDFGFIEKTRQGGLSRKTRIASEWRLTAFRCDLTGSPKSCLFMQRGQQAHKHLELRSRPQFPASLSRMRASQEPSPVPNEGRECPIRGHSLSQTRAIQSPECPKRGPVEVDFEASPVPNESTHVVYHPQGDPETTSDTGSTTAIEPVNSPLKPLLADAAEKSHSARSWSMPESAAPASELTWLRPVVRELLDDEARARRAECDAGFPA